MDFWGSSLNQHSTSLGCPPLNLVLWWYRIAVLPPDKRKPSCKGRRFQYLGWRTLNFSPRQRPLSGSAKTILQPTSSSSARSNQAFRQISLSLRDEHARQSSFLLEQSSQ